MTERRYGPLSRTVRRSALFVAALASSGPTPDPLAPRVWLDLSVAASILDAPAGSPISNGGTCGQLLDQSGNGHHVSQATSYKRPTYSTAGGARGNKPELRFDGANDVMLSESFTASGAATYVAVCRVDSSTPYGILAHHDTGAGGVAGDYLMPTGVGRSRGTFVGQSTGLSYVDLYKVFVLTLDPATSTAKLYVNGDLVWSDTTPFGSGEVVGPFVLGGLNDGVYIGKVSLHEVRDYPRAMAASEVASLSDELMVKWDVVPLPTQVLGGALLRWYDGAALDQFTVNGDGTGGAPASSGTAGQWLDRSSHADPLKQATAGRRPTVKTHTFGRGVAVFGSGVNAGASGAYLETAGTVTGIKYAWVVCSIIGANIARDSSPPQRPMFTDNYRGFVGTSPVAFNAAIALGRNDAAESRWLRDPTALQFSEYYRDGTSIAVDHADPGWARTRAIHRFKANTTFSAGQIEALRAWAYDDYYARGALHEVILADATVSDAQIAAIEEHLFETHHRGNLVVFTGDSRMAGYPFNETQTPSALAHERWNRTVSCPNIAVPGQGFTSSTAGVSSTLLANDAAKLTSLKKRYRNVIVCLLAGTNDIFQGRTAAQVYADKASYGAMVRGLGCQLIACDELPRTVGLSGWTSGMDAQKNALNALEAANHSYADGWFQASALSWTLHTDGVHLTAADNVTLMNAFFPLIEARLT